MGNGVDTIVLGAEVEFEVINNPGAPFAYKTDYEYTIAYHKGKLQGNLHEIHGNIVQKVDEATKSIVKVGYDWTAAAKQGWGIELIGDPLNLKDSKEIWAKAYEAVEGHVGNNPQGKTQYGNPVSCGMHVHVSGNISKLDLGKVVYFVYSKANTNFITAIANRYNNHYCHILSAVPPNVIAEMYHADDCKVHPGKSFGNCKPQIHTDYEEGPRQLIPVRVGPGGDLEYEWQNTKIPKRSYCCDNGRKYSTDRNVRMFIDKYSGERKVAVNLSPTEGTGLFEFRLFESPLDIETFNARLEWVHALINFCQKIDDVNLLTHQNFCNWLLRSDRRNRYISLFEMIVGLGYINRTVMTIDKYMDENPEKLDYKMIKEVLKTANH